MGSLYKRYDVEFLILLEELAFQVNDVFSEIDDLCSAIIRQENEIII